MLSKYKIISCTKSNREEFFNKTPLGISIEKLSYLNSKIFTYDIEFNNTKGISEIYNKAIINSLNDYLIFTHDDIYLNDMFMFEKLEEGFQKYDIIGVAGSSNFDIKREPICWHNSPRESYSGGCFHPKVDKTGNINDIYWTEFGQFNKKCICLDGLFIAVNLKKIKEYNVLFDERLTFDFYDLDFTLQCTLKNLRVGTIPISITHMSHGAGIKKDSYIKMQEIFKQKYKR